MKKNYRKLYEAKEFKDIKEILYNSVKIYKDKIAFVIKHKENKEIKYENITYPKLLEDVNSLGTSFYELGLKGKRIAIIGKNRYEWAISHFGALLVEIVSVPLDKDLQYDELENSLIRSKADCIIFDEKLKNTIDEKQIIKLCQDIKNYQRVAIFGLLKAGSVAINLQGDFLMLNKQIYTNISYPQQIEYILNTDDKDLIIILSYTGAYFDYEDLRANYKKLKASKIWMISSQQKTYPDFVNEVLSFESLQDQSSHPYQLQFIASIIAQEYAKRYK